MGIFCDCAALCLNKQAPIVVCSLFATAQLDHPGGEGGGVQMQDAEHFHDHSERPACPAGRSKRSARPVVQLAVR